MNITLSLSPGSIDAAIRELETVKDNIEYGVQQTVEMLTQEGADIAKRDYGSMASVDYATDETTGIIGTSGQANIIAEFGAGDATITPMFENYVGVDVYPGAYSELVGSGEYAETGKWHFGGKTYTEVQPRMGLLDAKLYIEGVAVELAQEVIQL